MHIVSHGKKGKMYKEREDTYRFLWEEGKMYKEREDAYRFSWEDVNAKIKVDHFSAIR
ncbi:hypothetical protein HV436_19050 [Bacillus sporothermodurans]|nr:hypothetical protein [Heyndrickxia sporothermodurans]MBL5801482.1 hypothetical protein [Heyndrickxia sporothermodurans]MBL5812583.1 hypothetical protein [Heyndrickxia sporothermodurans]MBL5816013.1 hypothetical protein [Heyndrickxia sporothermodurans]MBL5819458.1 hypothetical protein [Heyndrickxia sporothermodurans]MBL5844568.1 hypothetical protein [Heyndrickxia sporothermodurans]